MDASDRGRAEAARAREVVLTAIKPIKPIRPIKKLKPLPGARVKLPVATCEMYTEGVVMLCPLCQLPVKGHHKCRKESK